MKVMAGQTAQALIRGAAEQLQAAGCASPRQDAEWLLGRLLGLKPTELYCHDSPVLEEAIQAFDRHIRLRAQGEPLQYLLGSAEFFGRSFIVEPGVFIPRPETESVVEAAVAHLRKLQQRLGRPIRLVDACTGSGCIAVTVACELEACAVTAIEVSCNAICVARKNVIRHGLSPRVQLIRGRWLEPLRSGSYVDAIVSNPPYVPSGQLAQLPADVRQEPRLSLDGGPDGLRDMRRILKEVPRVLRPGGFFIFECGEDQVELLIGESSPAPWVASIDRIRDLAGRLRGCVISRG